MDNFMPKSYIDPKNFEELSDLIGQLYQAEFSANEATPEFKGSHDIVKCLNKIFNDKNCTGFIYTNNIDNEFFGVFVNPLITNTDLMNILIDTEEYQLDKYQVELDSKLLALGSDYATAYIIEDIANTMYPTAISNVRAYIDEMLASTEDNINIKNTINCNTLIIWGLKDAIHKLSSMKYRLYDSDVFGVNRFSRAFNLHDTLTICADMVKKNTVGLYANMRRPNMSPLQWAFVMYKDFQREYRDVVDKLADAIPLTGSKLMKNELERTIKSLNRASSEVFREQTDMLQEAHRISLFKQLKQNGLRSVENQLYEFKVRIRSCSDEDEAMYIMRGISANLAILKDYIDNTPNMSDSERARWEDCIDQYRQLRREAGSMKFQKYNFLGNFDYSQLDKLDANRPNNTPGYANY